MYRADHDRNRRRSRFKSNVFNANECDEIVVENAGIAPTNGVYVRSEAPLLFGGVPEYGYFCKNNNCTAGVFHQWGADRNPSYGWVSISFDLVAQRNTT